MVNSNYHIYRNVRIGKNCSVGDFVIVGEHPKGKADGELETVIGDNAIVRTHTVIYAGNKIGNNFQTGHHVLIRENNVIGNDFVIGSFSEIAFDVKVGNNVRLHSNCHIYEGTVIEDDVRFNPGVHILNCKFPYRPSQEPLLEPVVIRRGAILAACSVIMPAVEVGRYALIGAGSLVTRSVPDYAVVYGRPAQIKGDIRQLRDKKGDLQYVLRESRESED